MADFQAEFDRTVLNLPAELRARLPDAMEDIGAELALYMRNGESEWPVVTGLSRANFNVEPGSDGGFDLVNSADYAVYVEARGGYIVDAWAADGDEIVERALRDFEVIE